MRAVLQRVSKASVTVEGKVMGRIGAGLVVLLGVAVGDTEKEAELLADKVAHLRVFSDEEGKMNRSILEVGGEVLVISQFTLLADIRQGRRPAFVDAAPPGEAEPLIDRFGLRLRNAGLQVATGMFGAKMLVEISNDGPVTIVLEAVEGRLRGND